MSMKNHDKIREQKVQLLGKITDAISAQDTEALSASLGEYGDMISAAMREELNGTAAILDNQILATRGTRVLTSAEIKYYNAVIEAAKSGNPQMAIANITETMPETIFESVFDDIRTAHPLLNLIDFKNTTGITKYMVNEQGAQLAVWGELGSAITQELSGALGVFNVTLMKLSAFMPISFDMLDLGAAWLDRYVREILIEALAYALEKAIVAGTGKNEPIGMCKDISKTASVQDGVYPDKKTVALKTISPATFGELCAKVCKAPNGNTRTLENLIFVVNPIDYYTKVMPATTYFIPTTGAYVHDIFPVPLTLVPSAAVPEGKAIFGLAKRYFMGAGMSKNGKLEYDDSVRFLEDQRCYKIKTYANGKPLDDNAFVYLDISKLERDIPTVKTITDATE